MSAQTTTVTKTGLTKADFKVMRGLAARNARLERKPAEAEPGKSWLLLTGKGQSGRPVDDHCVRRLLAQGVLEPISAATGIGLSPAGKAALRRYLAGDDFAGVHREMSERPEDLGAASSKAKAAMLQVNLAESPLQWLASRKDRKGRPLLQTDQIRAGEKLRADYTFACLMPTVGPGWRVEQSGRGGGSAGNAADLSDDVIAARHRTEAVLARLQPTLSSLLVDVCCHLKGLETVETERAWPARSAKIVLQIALSALAEAYGFKSVASDRHSGRIRTHSASQSL